MKPALSLGFFGLFGRSASLRSFDADLRALDLHPNLVPEAVKLTAVRMLMDQTGSNDPSPAASHAAAQTLAYCMVGTETFAATNGTALAQAIEQRIDAALEEGTNLDAKLILLALHANVIQPSVVKRFALEVSRD